MKERIENIEKRLDRVERMIEKIIALPQLTNLAGNDIALQIQRTLERRCEELSSKQENKSVRINLLFRPGTKKNIEKLALVNQTSINDFINTVLDEYIAAHADEIAKYDSFFSEG